LPHQYLHEAGAPLYEFPENNRLCLNVSIPQPSGTIKTGFANLPAGREESLGRAPNFQSLSYAFASKGGTLKLLGSERAF
jgi:hypothetical protein